MNLDAVLRYVLTAILLVGVLVLLTMEKVVPDWLIAITGTITGNTFRLQFQKKDE